MASWVGLLPQAPKPQSASDVYQDALRGQQMRQNMQQTAEYRNAQIREQNALAQQHERVTAVKNGLAKAYAANLKTNPDGTATVNSVGVLKDLSDMGYADEAPEILKQASAQRKADLENLEGKAKYTASKLGAVPRVPQDGWTNPNLVQDASFKAITAINELEREGILSPQDAAAQRAAAANYTPQFQSFLDAHSQQADALGKQFSNAKAAVDLHVDQLTGQPKIDKAVADASSAGTKAIEDQAKLAGQLAGAGAYPQSSNVGQPAPQAANPYGTPAGAAPVPAQPGAPQPNPYTAPTPVGGTVPQQPVSQGPYTDIPGVERGGFTGQSDLKRDANGNIVVIPRSMGGGAPAAPQQFETQLTPAEETSFQAWKKQYAPNDSGADYDLRGAFKAGLKPDAATGHWPDTFKKPNHPTFSNESQYAKDAPDKAGHWEGSKFVPPGAAKDPDWTQEKQQQWDALRADPSLARISRFLSPTWSKGAEETAKRLGMTREQQVQADARVNKPEAEDKKLKLMGTKLGAAAEQGPAAYTRAYDALTPEEQKLAPKPEQWDKEKTPRLARLIGMTANEQDKATKPSKSGMSESQERMWIDRHDKLQTEEQNTWKSVGEIGDILNTKGGEDYRDPKTGKSVEMDAVQRTHWQKEYEGARTRAMELQKQAKQIRGRLKIGEFESGAAAPAESAAPAEATAPASSPATASVAPPAGGRVKVTLPNGKTIVFPSQKAADEFKSAAKIK